MSAYNDPNIDNLAESPLREQARGLHRTLLVVAALAGLIGALDLTPKRISAVGLELQSDDRNAIRVALLLTVIYLAVSFYVTARADYELWRLNRRAALEMRSRVREQIDNHGDLIDKQVESLQSDPQRITSGWSVLENLERESSTFKLRESGYRLLLPLSATRAFLDFGLPLLVAAWAIAELAYRLS